MEEGRRERGIKEGGRKGRRGYREGGQRKEGASEGKRKGRGGERSGGRKGGNEG